jgi:hypothetical protein
MPGHTMIQRLCTGGGSGSDDYMMTLRQWGLIFIVLSALLNILAVLFNKKKKELDDNIGWDDFEEDSKKFWFVKYGPHLQILGVGSALLSAFLIYLDP